MIASTPAPADAPADAAAAATPVDVVIIGAGFSGLGMAIMLKEANRRRARARSFVVLEKAQAVGGTWRENTYPGCACDISSHLYSFSFAPEPNWSRMYPTQPEIQAYLERCVREFGIGPALRFGREVRRLTWREADGRWLVEAATGERWSARAVVSGMGGLHKPAFPELPGLGAFAGPAWHSARWDHSVDLRGKRVAVIGTGASAIQFVPQIQPQAAQIDLYQRSPPWIYPKADRDMSLWERGFFTLFPPLQEGYRRTIWALNELRGTVFQHPERAAKAEVIARRFLEASVPDPALRAKLTPDYRLGCKRVLISNDYYPAVRQPNVSVVTDPIAEIAVDGVVTADGVRRPCDVLIYATGFKAMDVLDPVVVIGREGRALNAAWAAQPGEAYWGVAVAGYPNFFLLMGPNTGLGHNSMVFMIESQIAFVMDALATLEAEGARGLDVRTEAQRRFVEMVDRRLAGSVWASGCRSWYVDARGVNRTLWPGLTWEYRQGTRRLARADFEAV